MIINILGTPHEIVLRDYDEDPVFKDRTLSGYHDGRRKKIVVCNMATHPGYEHEDEEYAQIVMKEILRHEIIHAFLTESGLEECADDCECWSKHEEMIDWFALQGPKIYEAWKQADAI